MKIKLFKFWIFLSLTTMKFAFLAGQVAKTGQNDLPTGGKALFADKMNFILKVSVEPNIINSVGQLVPDPSLNYAAKLFLVNSSGENEFFTSKEFLNLRGQQELIFDYTGPMFIEKPMEGVYYLGVIVKVAIPKSISILTINFNDDGKSMILFTNSQKPYSFIPCKFSQDISVGIDLNTIVQVVYPILLNNNTVGAFPIPLQTIQ